MNTTLQNAYDEFPDTHENKKAIFNVSEILDAFYQRLDINKGRLLDLGCGAGDTTAKLFIDRDWQVTGVDFSEKMLDLASRYVPQMEAIHADICHIDFPQESFNGISAIYSLFHIPKENHNDLFRKFYHWLRHDGKMLFTYATKEYTGSNEFEGFKNFMGHEFFYSHTTPENLYAMLERIGFHIESSEYREIGGEMFLWITLSKPVA